MADSATGSRRRYSRSPTPSDRARSRTPSRTRSRRRSRSYDSYDSYDSDSFASDTESNPAARKTKKNNTKTNTTLKKGVGRGGPIKGKKNTGRQSKVSPREMDQITKRMLSARRMKINELKNEVESMTKEVDDLRNENKTLRKQHHLNERALARFEIQENDLPNMISRHQEEVRALKEQLRRIKEKYQKTERRLKESEDELLKTKKQLKKVKALADDKQLGERDDLNRKLSKAEIDVEDRDKRIKDLQKHIDHLNKNHRHELGIEMARHKETQRKLTEMEQTYQKAQTTLKEKEKELDIKNIYSNRIIKPPHKLNSTASSSASTPLPPSGRKRVRKSSEPSVTPRDRSKQYEEKRREEDLRKQQQRKKVRQKSERQPPKVTSLREIPESSTTKQYKKQAYERDYSRYNNSSGTSVSQSSGDAKGRNKPKLYPYFETYNYEPTWETTKNPKFEQNKKSQKVGGQNGVTFKLDPKTKNAKFEQRRDPALGYSPRNKTFEDETRSPKMSKSERIETNSSTRQTGTLSARESKSFTVNSYERQTARAQPNETKASTGSYSRTRKSRGFPWEQEDYKADMRRREEETNRREMEKAQQEEREWFEKQREREERERKKEEEEKRDREEEERRWQEERNRRKEEAEAREREAKEKRDREQREREEWERKEREEREKREQEERERREREEQERREQEQREKDEAERRAKEEADRLAADKAEQDRRRQKELLLARMKEIDTTKKNSSPTYSFNESIENMHHGKPAHKDVKVPVLEKTKKKNFLDDDDDDSFSYKPSFLSTSKPEKKPQKKTSLFDDDTSQSRNNKKNNLMSDLFGDTPKKTEKPAGDDGLVFGSPKKQGSSRRTSSIGTGPAGARENSVTQLFGGGSALVDESDLTPKTSGSIFEDGPPKTSNNLLPRRQRQSATTFSAKPTVNAVDDFDDDIEEVML